MTLLLPASAAWVAESYPAESVDETADGRLRVRLAVSEPAWLARLLLRVGPDARVEDPPELKTVASRCRRIPPLRAVADGAKPAR